jgi:hypothetical protein
MAFRKPRRSLKLLRRADLPDSACQSCFGSAVSSARARCLPAR